MNLATNSYGDVVSYLKLNLLKEIKQKPCVEIVLNHHQKDLYELFIIGNNDYFNYPHCDCSITYGECYYYVLKYTDDSFYNELSVLDCGGYYIAICIFKNKLNITNEVLHNNQEEDMMKFKMNTCVGLQYQRVI